MESPKFTFTGSFARDPVILRNLFNHCNVLPTSYTPFAFYHYLCFAAVQFYGKGIILARVGNLFPKGVIAEASLPNTNRVVQYL